MNRDQFLQRLAGLNRAPVPGRAGQRAPHKPLLLLWLFGRYLADGPGLVSYEEAEAPVSSLIDEFGPPATSPRRASMPFFHLKNEPDLWHLSGDGELDDQPGRLRRAQATGRLGPEVEALFASDPGALPVGVQFLIGTNFTDALAEPIAAAAGLGDLELSAPGAAVLPISQRRRDPRFREEVLQAYAYECAMCGWDGRVGRAPVGVEAAHVYWFSQGGPDEVDNGLALCGLHHMLFDLGVLGLTKNLEVKVSLRFVGSSATVQAQVHDLAGRPLAEPQPGRPPPAMAFVRWHDSQVFKSA